MKLSNIFKKSTKTVVKSNVETLAKNQLEKVVGGADTVAAPFVPGGSVISAAVSSVSTTKGGSSAGAAAASYA